MNNLKKIYPLILLVSLLFSISCQEENGLDLAILTEETINLTGERAIVSGRILATSNVALEDHGFYFSLDENFSSPIRISLGEIVKPGRFVGEINSLELGKKYFFKAYGTNNGTEISGNTLTLETLNPLIEKFEPMTQSVGATITISGRNIGTDAQVFFGDTQAKVIKIEFGFRITVEVPPSSGFQSVPLKVITRGVEIFAQDNFNFPSGVYTRLGSFPEPIRMAENIYFQQGNRFFAGLGFEIIRQPVREIWEYSPDTEVWKKTLFEGNIHRSAFFSKSGYFGGGFQDAVNPPQTPNHDFWFFDGTQYRALPSPPNSYVNAMSFEANGGLFVAGGDLGIGSTVYFYNPQLRIWILRPNMPFNVNNGLFNFEYNNKLYFLDKKKNLWEYDPNTALAKVITEYPGIFIEGSTDFGGTGIVVGDKVYIGLYNNNNELWEYDFTREIWSKKNVFPGVVRAVNVGIFHDQGLIYILRSPLFGPIMEFWSLDPDKF